MLTYIVRRVIAAIGVIILVSILIFILLRLLPGDPIEMILSATQMQEFTQEMIDAVRAERGLDRPLHIQYLYWLGNMLRGDFGMSIVRNFDIRAELHNRMMVSLTIGISAFVIGFIVGPILGIISAIRRGKFIDNLVTTLANIGITAPTFWVAILLLYFFALRLQLVPVFGYTLPWVDFEMSIRQGILPVFVTALAPIATSARQTRSSVIEIMNEDYIRTAWAKGLSERKIIVRHVLKNSLMPVITLQGTMFRLIIGGSVIVERIFVIPGMGNMLVDGMLSRDYTVVQAITVIMTAVVVLTSLIVDLLYGWIDPRIQYE